MWSVNLDLPISGEYETLGGHSDRPWDNWDLWWLVQEYHGRDCNKFQNTLERWREIWERRRQASECRRPASVRRRLVWEHLQLLQSILGKSSSFGTLLVRLEIVATTYRSTIFKTHVFSLYSHLYIDIATHLHTVYLDWLQGSAWEQF